MSPVHGNGLSATPSTASSAKISLRTGCHFPHRPTIAQRRRRDEMSERAGLLLFAIVVGAFAAYAYAMLLPHDKLNTGDYSVLSTGPTEITLPKTIDCKPGVEYMAITVNPPGGGGSGPGGILINGKTHELPYTRRIECVGHGGGSPDPAANAKEDA